jgi:hypothetical protein
MFGLFKKVIIDHSILGSLTRRGREWEGNIKLRHDQSVPLKLEGSKEAPHAETLAATLELPSKLSDLVPMIAKALLEHLEPYKEALSDPEDGIAEMYSDPNVISEIQKIATAQDAWAASEICGVEVGLVDGKVRLLIKVQSIWDEEHILGAYFDDWQFMELNGSV